MKGAIFRARTVGQAGGLQFAAFRGGRQEMMLMVVMVMMVMMIVVILEVVEAAVRVVVVATAAVAAVRLVVDGRLGGIVVAVVNDRGGRRGGEAAGIRSRFAQAAIQHELQVGPRPASRHWLAA